MITKLKTLLLGFGIIAGSFAPLALPSLAYAAAADPNAVEKGVCKGANLQFSEGAADNCASDDTASTRVDEIIKTVINIFSIIVGVISVIMIIIGGLKYITSGGDSGNVTGAKNTIMYAVIGLVVVVLAQVVVKFVLDKAGSV